MDESKMTATAADLERALVESLAEAAMPSLAATDNDNEQDHQNGDKEGEAAGEEDASALAYQDGDLPEFSDGESEKQAAAAAGSSSGAPRQGLVPGKSGKGPGGRRKIPLAAIKARMTGGGGGGSSSSTASKKAAPPAATATASSALTTAAATSSQDKGKGKSKELKLSDSQLDAVAQRIAQEHPELPKLSPEQVQELVASMQIDKDVILGKKGVMGKGTKDMANYATKPIAGGIDANEGGSGIGVVMLFLGETWRGRRAENKRRDGVKDALEQHEAQIQELEARIARDREREDEAIRRERELEKVVEEIVSIGLRGGFGELSDEWKRHLSMGELASRFRSAGRLLRDEDEDGDAPASADDDEPPIRPLPADAKDAVDQFREAVSSAANEPTKPSLTPALASPEATPAKEGSLATPPPEVASPKKSA
ncbi:hypothetical protein JCM10908_004461 [Rhodotorula pacifica]|uniref:uncharacterized protein n=1 Tax=Rhodotorula pacifica TaxID=1495444 RepID=UPI0031792A71